ncbi:MAG TPA: pyridoxamine 5'-phosphate oxidase family protein [Streptosporangiaceae bacterium]|nr:pyridoxamine 5'-phosphate oxidase family protein [Streptosporangiaceae bacterium]
MEIPRVSRPDMPGYGIQGPEEGSGLLPWSWAVERLSSARNYWVVSVRPDGRPHSMPVWGMWDDSDLVFTSGVSSRKIRNLKSDPRCVVSTEDASDPVIVEGTAAIVTDPARIQRVIELMNGKYGTNIEASFLDPAVNATVAVRPRQVIGMRHGDFTGSPTRWTFDT